MNRYSTMTPIKVEYANAVMKLAKNYPILSIYLYDFLLLDFDVSSIKLLYSLLIVRFLLI